MKYSIIIPHYNRPDLIVKCIKSFQNLQDKEIIIVDDVSTRENLSKLKENIDSLNDDSVFLFESKEKLDLGSARNLGLDLSKGEWIFFIDDDDLATDEFIDFLNSNKVNKKYDFYRFPQLIIKDGEKSGKKINIFPRNKMYSVQISTYLFKKSFMEINNIKFSNSIKRYFEDLYLNLLIYSKKNKNKYIKINSCYYRIFSNSNSLSNILFKFNDDIISFLKNNFFVILDVLSETKLPNNKTAILRSLWNYYITFNLNKIKDKNKKKEIKLLIKKYIKKKKIKFIHIFKIYWLHFFQVLFFYIKIYFTF